MSRDCNHPCSECAAGCNCDCEPCVRSRLRARAETAEAKLAAGQAGRARIGICECNRSHQCCLDEWQAAEAKLAEAERARVLARQAEIAAKTKRNAAESRARALSEALGQYPLACTWGPDGEGHGNCLVAGREKPCRACVSRAALGEMERLAP